MRNAEYDAVSHFTSLDQNKRHSQLKEGKIYFSAKKKKN